MKLITFTVPCYNSAAYMDRCVETLLPAGEEAEIILVDDGSKDDTGKIADAYAEKYPNIVKVIHQENRIKLMLAVAKERLTTKADPAPVTAEELAGGVPQVETQVPAML